MDSPWIHSAGISRKHTDLILSLYLNFSFLCLSLIWSPTVKTLRQKTPPYWPTAPRIAPLPQQQEGAGIACVCVCARSVERKRIATWDVHLTLRDGNTKRRDVRIKTSNVDFLTPLLNWNSKKHSTPQTIKLYKLFTCLHVFSKCLFSGEKNLLAGISSVWFSTAFLSCVKCFNWSTFSS